MFVLKIMGKRFHIEQCGHNKKRTSAQLCQWTCMEFRDSKPQSPLDHLSAALKALNTVLRWLLLGDTDVTVTTAKRNYRKEVCQERVSAMAELKCNENLNKTNGGRRKDIRFDLRKNCQEPVMSLRRDGQVMMLSSEPERVGAKVRKWASGWGWACIR